MRTILFKISKFPLVSETFIVNQITLAIDLGFDVIILTNELNDFKKSQQLKILEDYKLKDKVEVISYKIPENYFYRIIKAAKLFLFNIFKLQSLLKYISLKNNNRLSSVYEFNFFRRFRNVDLIHIQYGTNSKPIDDLNLAGILKMPVILTFHGHDAFFPINGIIKERGYYDKIFKIADTITVNTPYLKNQLIKIHCPKNKLKVIPVPINTDFFYTKDLKHYRKNKEIKLLSVGRLERIKGHDQGIKVVRILLNKGYNVKYTIIGEGKFRPELEKLIQDYSLSNRVEILGTKSQEEIREFYWKSDVFLMTSRPVKGIRETQGLVSLEAQACGLPVVAFDSGGIKYTIKDGVSGLLAKENDIECFAGQVEKLVKSSSTYTKLCESAPNFVRENFSKNLISKNWEIVYN